MSPRSGRNGDFYSSALSRAERVRLAQARDMEGSLDEEIALLRLRLRRAAQERPEDLELLLKGVNTLVRAVSARYKLSGQEKDELMDHIIGVIRGVGGELMPEVFGEGKQVP